jgi:tRNA (guanine-N7-)-methyltransferase
MRAVCSGEPLLENTSTAVDGWTPRPEGRPETKFERRALAEGRDVRDLVFRRISTAHPQPPN